MQVKETTSKPQETDADVVAIGVFDGDDAVNRELLDDLFGDHPPKTDFGKLATTRAHGQWWIICGLGDKAIFSPERARVVAAKVLKRAREVSVQTLCWTTPNGSSVDHLAGLVEGTLLADYRFDEYKAANSGDGPELSELIIAGNYGGGSSSDGRGAQYGSNGDTGDLLKRAQTVSEAANFARDLQNSPPNDMTPRELATRAGALAEEHADLTCEVWGRAEIEAAGMGSFAGVARGSDEEPQLITLTYSPPDAVGPTLGFVGKAVTFDTGGISLKPGMKMSAMKFDMSGGAAVLGATAAIARLGLPVRLVSVIGATENMPSGNALKPGDIVRAKTGITIEVINTDAEGRLVLCDCLAHAIDRGAERLVDIATLTGAIVSAFGSTYAGIMSNDDAWCESVTRAGAEAGELVWRLPLHEEYAEMMKGEYADLVNVVEDRRAGSICAAEFLARFVGEIPWAHLDIAGIAANNGRAYTPAGGAGWGVRLLVNVAEGIAHDVA